MSDYGIFGNNFGILCGPPAGRRPFWEGITSLWRPCSFEKICREQSCRKRDCDQDHVGPHGNNVVLGVGGPRGPRGNGPPGNNAVLGTGGPRNGGVSHRNGGPTRAAQQANLGLSQRFYGENARYDFNTRYDYRDFNNRGGNRGNRWNRDA